jgi:hypothetical protein
MSNRLQPLVPNSKYRHMENRITAYYSCSKYYSQQLCPRHHRMPCNQLANGTNEPQTIVPEDQLRNPSIWIRPCPEHPRNGSMENHGKSWKILMSMSICPKQPPKGSANWFKGQHIHISYQYIPRGNKKNRNT